MTSFSRNPRRRFLRFSLRGLLLVVLVVGAGLGWAIHEAKKQGIAVAELEKLGCVVAYGHRSWCGSCDDEESPTVPERIRSLLGEGEWRTATRLEVNSTSQVTDDDLVHLHVLTGLRTLRLEGTDVMGTGLCGLQGLRRLSFLNLDETKVTDDGLVHLRRLTQLRFLRLERTQVTDAGLVHLDGLTHLEYLFLGGTQVTDAGLAHLKGLAHLELVSLRNTLVTDAAVLELQQALPNCIIIH